MVAETLLSALASEAEELSILITDDREIQHLNQKYRGINSPTDVLSFPQNKLESAGNRITPVLGDIVISLETALRHSIEDKRPFHEEFFDLLVHGLLHLKGYEHEGVTGQEAERMFKKQRELLEIVLRE